LGYYNAPENKAQALILFLFLFPLFFQLSGSIFSSPDLYFLSQGKILLIPIPLASIICFIGLAHLLRLENRHFGMGVVFALFMLMMLSIIISTGGEGKAELAKFVLLVQFILPLFSLVLGGLYLEPKSAYLSFEAVALYVLLLVIPLEVVATIVQGGDVLTPYLYFFSLYQHLEYLPAIFVGLYFLALAFSYQKRGLRYLVLFLAPWLGCYLAASMSLSGLILTLYASIVAIWGLYKKKKTGLWIIISCVHLFGLYKLSSSFAKTGNRDS
jgi:hypothetical protein